MKEKVLNLDISRITFHLNCNTTNSNYYPYVVYITELFFNPYGAGGSALTVDRNQIFPMFDVSLNIYFIGDICKHYGLPYFPVTHHHPIYESVFNVMTIWALVFVAFMLTDYRSRKMATLNWWIGNINIR